MAWALTELGRRTADIGVPLALHPHMGALSQSPTEIARILDAADSRLVRLELDIAHYAQGGGNPVQAVRDYAGRLLFLHIKDVESPVPGGKPDSYRFVELGRGKVDVRGVFAALKSVGFDGGPWSSSMRCPTRRARRRSRRRSQQYLRGLGLIDF